MVARAEKRTGPMAAGAGLPPSPAVPTAPRAAGRDDGSTRLWLQEPGQPTTWHIVNERIAYHWYRMACGWEVRLLDAERVWPAKAGDPQPLPRTQCRSCVQMQAINAVLGGPVFRPEARRAQR